MSLYFAVSSIHGVGLFSHQAIERGNDVTSIFKRINNTGIFAYDFRQGKYGKYINHSIEPNTDIIINAEEIIVRALKLISPGEEITENYYQLIRMFNNDASVIWNVKFW